MPKLCTFRARRRSAAEKSVLRPLQRAITSVDPVSRRKYVHEFTEAYQTYERVISKGDLIRFCTEADALLVSDFHALDSCQQFVSGLLEALAVAGRDVVLLLEAVFTRDQCILDEWISGRISDRELRHRLRFNADWGYAWEPFVHLLKTARGLRVPIYGADCGPRSGIRRISERDRHAADTIATVRERHPDSLLITLFGESHLAPSHLPKQVRERLPGERVRMVLQNVDALYFRSAGELRDHIEAVRVSHDVAAVFNATPLEKWQSYRFCIARWREQSRKTFDYTPALYDLIDALLAFLHIDRYGDEERLSRYFVDCYPEVANVASLRRAQSLLGREELPEGRRRKALVRLVEHGTCYLPELNLMVAHRMRMQAAAQDVARFVHHACRNFAETFGFSEHVNAEEALYRNILEHALVDFGGRVIYPSHPVSEEDQLLCLYGETREEVEAKTFLPYREYIRMLDCVMLHRDYEVHHNRYAAKPALLEEFLAGPQTSLELLAQHLGALLGGDLYRSYVSGRFSRSEARSLFFRRLTTGTAKETYFSIVRRVRPRRADLLAA
jgi:hypothetical protein